MNKYSPPADIFARQKSAFFCTHRSHFLHGVARQTEKMRSSNKYSFDLYDFFVDIYPYAVDF